MLRLMFVLATLLFANAVKADGAKTQYFGAKCFGFLAGAEWQPYFRWFFIAAVVFGASVSVDVVFNLISGSYGLMALPTMVSTIILAPKVMAAARDYFARLEP